MCRNGWKCFRGNIRSNKIFFEHVRKIMETMDDIRSVVSRSFEAEGPYIERILTEKIEMDTGKSTGEN